MYVPDFKTVVMPAVVAAMDEWKADAEKSELALKLGQMHTQSKAGIPAAGERRELLCQPACPTPVQAGALKVDSLVVLVFFPPAVAMMLLDMERSYMTAGFFRHTMHHRANKIKQQLAMMKAAETQQTKGGFLMGGGGGGGRQDCPVLPCIPNATTAVAE
jgi:phosphoribosylcarboxyaminoimidazole (NCAIR) mutase